MRPAMAACAAIILLGCASTRVNGAAFAISTMLIVCDGMQTARMAGAGWTDRTYETNPIMGEKPSVGVVGAYFSTVIAANALLWVVMPHRYKSIAAAAVSTRQSIAIANNVRERAGVCGF